MSTPAHNHPLTAFSFGLIAVIVSLVAWMFAFYPFMGNDFAANLPLMEEMRQAWHNFGVLDPDFSPFRCFGLPLFGNPNSLVWSLFHPAALVFSNVGALFAVLLGFVVFGYVGAYRLVRDLRLSAGIAAMLAMGWCLQGFAVSHLLAGHASYLQIVLFPFFLWVVMQPRAGWVTLGALVFWVGHLLYTSGYYIFLFGVPSLVASAWVLNYLVPDRMRECGFGGARTACVNLAKTLPFGFLIAVPKILSVLNFTGKFPRVMPLDRIAMWDALVYSVSNFFYPFPWDIRFMTHWWYGNWEAYEFIFPGLFVWVIYALIKHRARLPLKRFGIVAAGIVIAGTYLSSGAEELIFQYLPVFKSLHVNPRWNEFVMLPFMGFVIALFVLTENTVKNKRGSVIPWIFGLVFFAVPFSYLDKETMTILYQAGNGMDVGRGRLAYCYEPIFGYDLATFPGGREQDFTKDVLLDPRCYLKSYACHPGAHFGEDGTDAADETKLRDYSLRDDYAPVRYTKLPALLLYLAALVAMGMTFYRMVRRLREE